MRPSDAKAICDQLTRLWPRAKAGSLRVWGQWFGGRAGENVHCIVRCEADADTLRLWFDAGETLTVDSPFGFEVSSDAFSINMAKRVRWEWFYYGRPQTLDNRFYEEFIHASEDIIARTNADWYQPQFKLSLREKAVEII